MKRKRTVPVLFTFILIAALFAGCSKKEISTTLEDPNTVPEDPYEISWYIATNPQEDVHSVELAVNEYLKDKINATVKINAMGSEQYKKKMSAMIAAGEYFDLCFVAHWMLDYNVNAANGAFLALDDYLDTYLSKITKEMDKSVLESARVNGKIYALPVWKEVASQKGWIYRKDIADKYNIDMSQYKSFEELEPVLHMIKEKEPGMQYPIDWDGNRSPAALNIQFSPATALSIYRDGQYPMEKVYIQPEVDAYKRACKTAYDFYKKGLVKKDVLTATDLLQRANDGRTFCFLENLKPGKVDEMFKSSDFEWAQVPVTPAMIDVLPGTGSMMAVSATSKNPVRAIRFLEILNTDKYLKNLIIYGIEGKHYTKIDENTVEPKPNTKYNLASYSWSIGNVFIDYLAPHEDPQKHEKLLEFNRNAMNVKCNLFRFDSTSYEQIDAACAAVKKQYGNQCILGAMDPEPIIEEYISKLKAAGIEELRDGVQKQYDEYLKNLE